jgi:membrane protein DedA with SNARE-associated domain
VEPGARGEEGGRRSPLWLVAPLVVIFGTAAIGNAAFPALVNDHPLVLLALNATTRHLVATSTSVDVVPYVLVALARRLVEDPFLYLLGRRYGDGAVEWMARRLGGATMLRRVRRRFRGWGTVLVFFFPGGAALFLVLNVVGTLVTIALLRSAGEEVEGPLSYVLDVVGDNVASLTVVSVVLTLAVVTLRRRRAGSSDLEELGRLEAERRARSDGE